MSSSWPTPQDYNEAIQHPASCFADDALKRGTVEFNHLGLPRSITGAFASVYRLTENKRSWAVRCFLKFRPDQQERYEKVSQYVMFDELEYTVHFEYLSKGIKVRGGWFPILKMEWVEGQTLDQYLEANVKNRSQMKSLLAKFDQMMAEMKAAGIAHGDLQHGNIMVVNGDLRLVDYDGMYVPKLAGWPSLELGHSNYQHPLRSDTDFDPALDNFSAHVIRTSLLTFIEDSSIWSDSHVGDECLLFKKRDFVKPDQSELFSHLLSHKSQDVKLSSTILNHLCRCLPSEVPYLGTSPEDILSIPVCVVPPDSQAVQGAERPTNRANRYETDLERSSTAKKSAKPISERFHANVLSAAKAKLKLAANRAWDIVVPRVSPLFAAERAIVAGDHALANTDYAGAIASFTRALQIIEQTTGVGTIVDDALKVLILSKIATACMLDHRPALVTHHLKEARKLTCNPKSIYFNKAMAHLAVACFEKGQTKEAQALMSEHFRDKNKVSQFVSYFNGGYHENKASVAQLLAFMSGFYEDSVGEQHLALACCHGALEQYERSQSQNTPEQMQTRFALRLRLVHCHLNIDQVSAAQIQCRALFTDLNFLDTETRARVVLLGAFFIGASGNFDHAYKTLTTYTTSAMVLDRAIRDELRGPLKTYYAFAELLRELAIRYGGNNRHEEAKICYTNAASLYREYRKLTPREHMVAPDAQSKKASKKSAEGKAFADTYQLNYAECLIGQCDLVEASKFLKKFATSDTKRRAADAKQRVANQSLSEKQYALETSLALAFESVGDYESALAIFENQQGPDGADTKRVRAAAEDAQIKKAKQLASKGKFKDAKRIYESLQGEYKEDIQRLKHLIREADIETAANLVARADFEGALSIYLRLESPTSENVVSTKCKLIFQLLEDGKGSGDTVSDYGKLRRALDHLEELAYFHKLDPSTSSAITDTVCKWGAVRGRSFRRWIESLIDCFTSAEGSAGSCVKRLRDYESSLSEKRVAQAVPPKDNPFKEAAILLNATDSIEGDEPTSSTDTGSQSGIDDRDEQAEQSDASPAKSETRPATPQSSALAESLIGQGIFQLHNRRIAAAQASFSKARGQSLEGSHAYTKAVLALALSKFLNQEKFGAMNEIDNLVKSPDQVKRALHEITQGFVVDKENAADFCYLVVCQLEEKGKDIDAELATIFRFTYDLLKRHTKSRAIEQTDCFAGFSRVEEVEKELEKLGGSSSDGTLRDLKIKIARRWTRQKKFAAAKELCESVDGPKSEHLKWCLEEQILTLVHKACTSERKGDGPLREAFHLLTEMQKRKLLGLDFCLNVGKLLTENLPHSSILAGLGKELRIISDLFASVEGKDGPAANMLLSRIKGTGY